MSANLENSAGAIGLEKVSFSSSPKEGHDLWIMEKANVFQKNIYFCFTDYILKPLILWITTNWKILKEMGISDHLTYLLRNLYTGQEATVGTRHGKIDSLETGREGHQACIFSPCLFNSYAN